MSNPLKSSSPEAQGIASSAILAFLDAVETQINDLHSLMFLRHGNIVAQGWWSPYEPDCPHTLFSLTKSFTSTAVGLAVAEGGLTVDDPVLSFFPEEAPAAPSENLKAMRVRHLLSMVTGHDEDTTGFLFERQDGNWVKGFLERPVEHAPGTHFVYNSGASYMLSAIVQKLTGLTLLDYLQPRLFEPLGIENVIWESCPRGINFGGFGMSVKTEDIARFGQLYLQNGLWQGQQILPAAWVAEATAYQVPNEPDDNPDWKQGYGYQFWRCRHGVYRGDGAFGQFCVVMPEQDAVLAITAGVQDMQSVLDLVWEHLLPALGPAPLPEDTARQQALEQKLSGLVLPPMSGQPTPALATRVSEKLYLMETNDQQIEAISFDFGPAEDVITIRTDQGEHQIICGRGAWVKDATAFDNDTPRPVAASGAWTAEETYVIKLCFYETPFCPTITCQFVEKGLTVDIKDNVAFGPLERPQLVGRAD